MSTVISSACWPLEGMSATQKLVLMSLADQANDDGVCWPGMSRLMRRTCLTDRAIRAAIRWLEDAGLLVTTGRSGTSNVYKITVSNYQKSHSTPERGSSPESDSAPERDSVTPERGSSHPGTSFREPRNVVPPNRKEPSVNRKEPSAAARAKPDVSEKLFPQQQDRPRTYRMTSDWQPPETFEASARIAAIDPALLTDAVLDKFRNHFADGVECTAGQWVNRLVDWLKREKAAQVTQSAQARPVSDGPGWMALQPFAPMPPKVPKTPEEMAEIRAKRLRIMGN